ncbi:MAG TPA: AsmA-like C-terminal region-containing protein [Rhodomicrobium sp.]|nr:AsmA-like C-terminal region-containing protein [Rhodomicrobium sp.]
MKSRKGLVWHQAIALANKEIKCGARNKDGTLCHREGIPPTWRCEKHGGVIAKQESPPPSGGKKRMNRGALAGAVLVGAGLTVASVGLPALGPVTTAINQYSPELSNRMKIASARFKLLPVPSLVADDISLSAPDNPQQKLAHARQGVFRIPLSSVFSSNPRVSAISLQGVTYYLNSSTQAASRAASSVEAALAADVAKVESITIEDGSVAFLGNDGKENVLVSGVKAELAPPSKPGEPRPDASETVGDNKVEVASSPGQPGQENRLTLPLRIEVGVSEKQPPLARASMTLIDDPETKLISFPDIAGSWRGEPFKASATVDRAARKPLIAASASLDSLKLAVPAGGGQDSGAESPGVTPFTDLTSIVSGDLFDLNLRLSAAKMELTGGEPGNPWLVFAPVDAQVSLSGGNLAIDLSKSEGYGGTLSGQFSLQKGKTGHADLQVRNVSLPLVLARFNADNAIKGSLDMSGRLETSGAQDPAREPLSGTLAVDIRNGSINAPAFMQTIQKVYSSIQPGGRLDESGRLPFTLLAGRASIDHGTLKADDISFDSANLRASGRGQALLRERKLDFKFNPQFHLLRASSGTGQQWQAAGFPVFVRGSFDAPELSLDAGSLPGGPAASDTKSAPSAPNDNEAAKGNADHSISARSH